MGIRDIIGDIIDGKRQWRTHLARVKALPPDYQIVYQEIQRYLFKVGGGCLLAGIVDFFEDGAAFCDDVVSSSRAHADTV